MQMQEEIEGSGVSLSFKCYSSDSITSRSVAKVIREQQVARFHEIDDVEDENFEFGFVLNEEEFSLKETDSRGLTVCPVFNRVFPVNDELDLNREIISKDEEIDVSSSITSSLQKLFIDPKEESSSCSSSESDELERVPSVTFCVWRPKSNGGSSPVVAKCRKSRSTGSGSKRWIIRHFLRRSNSEGKDAMLFSRKTVDSPNQKRSSGEALNVGGRWKARTPVHEQFYVQKRAENEVAKRKSYLPYRKDLVGFANVNAMVKMLPF